MKKQKRLSGNTDDSIENMSDKNIEAHDPRRINTNDNLDNESPEMDNEDNYGDNNGSEASQKTDYY